MEVTLTLGESNALLQLIHLAVQNRGLEVAEVAVMLQKKILAAQEESQKLEAA